MNKVVSIALFGERAGAYAQYVRAFVRCHLNVFPLAEDWRLRVHIDSQAAKSDTGQLIIRYANAGLLDSFLMYRDGKSPPLCKGMLWRVDPLFDGDVDYVFARDLDAPPMPRDRACCEQFIASQAAIGTIHDSDQHVGIMGGLCHFRASEFRRLTGLLKLDDLYTFGRLSDAEWSMHGADQIVLNRLLAAYPQLTLLEHRYNGWHAGPGAKPARPAGEYACQAWSTRVLDRGASKHSEAITERADRIGNHLGCAGYDHEAAVAFWDACGDPNIAALAAECERSS